MSVVRPVATDRDCEIRRQLEFPLERPGPSADVGDRIPGLLDDEPSPRVIADEDVDRVRRVRSPDPELKAAGGTDRARVAQQELLDREVAGVGHLGRWVARECEPRPDAERRAERDPCPDRCCGAETQLHPAHLALAQSNDRAEFRLGGSSPEPGRSHVATEPDDRLVREPIDLDLQLGAARALRGLRTRRMITWRPSLPITGSLAAASSGNPRRHPSDG
jgi:hypothetical protein